MKCGLSMDSTPCFHRVRQGWFRRTLPQRLEAVVAQACGVPLARLVPSPLAYGLACSTGGSAAHACWLPQAAWLGYVAPEHLSAALLRSHLVAAGRKPGAAVLQNQGIFVLGDSRRRLAYEMRRMLERLEQAYVAAGVSLGLDCADVPKSPSIGAQIRSVFGPDATHLASVGIFAYALGGITPNLVELAGMAPYSSPLTHENRRFYAEVYGAAPKIVVAGDRVYGLGRTRNGAAFALAAALEGALIAQLAEAFGGVSYLPGTRRDPCRSPSVAANGRERRVLGAESIASGFFREG